MKLVVGVADMKVVKDPEALLVTHALGSCIGICIWDKALKVGGLLHYMLPDSRNSTDKAQLRPYMYADVAIPLLFKKAYALGSVKQSLTVKLIGGAQVMNQARHVQHRQEKFPGRQEDAV